MHLQQWLATAVRNSSCAIRAPPGTSVRFCRVTEGAAVVSAAKSLTSRTMPREAGHRGIALRSAPWGAY